MKMLFKIMCSVLVLFVTWTTNAQDKEATSKLKKNQKSFALVGYGTLGYQSSGGDGGFTAATFHPIFVYKMNDKLSFKAELEIVVADEWDGAFALEFAEFNYQINNNLAFYGGKFLSPIGAFQSRLHPGWINKSINAPIGIQNDLNGVKRLQGDSELGFGFRGAAKAGEMRLNYDIFTTNGPRLTDEGAVDWENGDGDNNNSPAIGGRLGVLPFKTSNFELGLSYYSGKASEKGAADKLNVNLFVVDLSYVKQTEYGTFDVKGQFNNQKVTDAKYSGTPVPFQEFNNNTSAYYAQLAYRLPDSKFELVNRISALNVPDEVAWGADQSRYTLGVNYWLDWNTAIKVGYDFVDNDDNILGFAFAMGF